VGWIKSSAAVGPASQQSTYLVPGRYGLLIRRQLRLRLFLQQFHEVVVQNVVQHKVMFSADKPLAKPPVLFHHVALKPTLYGALAAAVTGVPAVVNANR